MKNLRLSGWFLSLFLGFLFLEPIQPCYSGDFVPLSWTAEEHYQEARSQYLRGDYQGALENAKVAIQKDPNHWGANQVAGYSCYKLGDSAASIQYGRRSLELNPNNPSLWDFLGKISPNSEKALVNLQRDSALPPADTKPDTGKPSLQQPRDEYGVLGLTLGSPSRVNLVGGYFFRGFGVKGSVGQSGIQLDLCKTLAGSNVSDVNLNFGLVLGHEEGTLTGTSTGLFGGSYSYSDSYKFDYIGCALDLQLRGVYLQAGPVIAQGTGYSWGLFGPSLRDYKGTVTYCLQFGYLLRI